MLWLLLIFFCHCDINFERHRPWWDGAFGWAGGRLLNLIFRRCLSNVGNCHKPPGIWLSFFLTMSKWCQGSLMHRALTKLRYRVTMRRKLAPEVQLLHRGQSRAAKPTGRQPSATNEGICIETEQSWFKFLKWEQKQQLLVWEMLQYRKKKVQYKLPHNSATTESWGSVQSPLLVSPSKKNWISFRETVKNRLLFVQHEGKEQAKTN